MVRLRIYPELPSPLRPTLGLLVTICLCALLPRFLGTLHGYDPDGNRAALLWIILTVAPGFAIWPIFFRTMTRMPDRGFSLALALGPYLQTYAAFIGAKAGLGVGPPGILSALGGMALVGIVSAWSQRRALANYIRLFWPRPAAVLIVGMIAFGLMISLRIHTPTISFHPSEASGPTVGDVAAEKFTDFTILNNLIQTTQLPPEDTWVAGLPLNYYYFGHLVHANIARVSGINPGVAYNLALGATAFLTAVAAMGLGLFAGRGRVWAGVLCTFIVMAAGNLDSILQALTLILGAPERALIKEFPLTGPWWTAYDFWRPSRAVIHTITEFPAFSFLLGDLHAHLLALPVMLAGTQLVLHSGRLLRHQRALWSFQFKHWEQVFLLSLVFGILSATNAWDALTLACLCTICLWFGGLKPNWGSAVESLLFTGLVVVFGAKVMFLQYASGFVTPFPPLTLDWDAGFIPQVASSPVKIVPNSVRSGLDEYLTHWGWLALPVVVWTISRIRTLPSQILGSKLSIFAVLTGLIWPIAGALIPSVLASSIIMAVGSQLVQLPPRRRPVSEWSAVALTLGTMLLVTELVYLDDIFGPPIERINTVFKVWYGLWTLVAALAVASFVRLSMLMRNHPPISRVLLTIAFVAPMTIYPLAGCYSRLRNTPPPVQPRLDMALDGLEYLRRERPDDMRAAEWLRDHAQLGKAILEAAGTQYSYNGRMATLSGKPTYAGWLNHALGWRGEGFTTESNRRFSVVSSIFNGTDPGEVAKILTEERIGYIVVGDLERKTYPDIQAGVLRALSEVAYESSNTLILKFRPEGIAPQVMTKE